MRNAIFVLITLTVLFGKVTISSDSILSDDAMNEIDSHYKKGIDQYIKGQFKAAASEFQAVVEKNVGDDVAMYMVATLLSRANDADASMKWLQKLDASGSCLSPLVASFAAINQQPEFRELASKLSERASKMRRTSTVVAVAEKDLTPEGIAYDERTKTFFLSSLFKRKILSVRMPEKEGNQPVIHDFIREAQDGFYSGLGMKVDAKRNQLWAASATQNIMKGYKKEDDGKTAIFVYDLQSGKLLRKYEKGPQPPHLLNDLVIAADGTAYVTDTTSGEIFRIRAAARDMEVLVPAGKLTAPNGIALSDDGANLYVADGASGVFIINPSNGAVRPLRQAPGVAPVFTDGLYFYNNSLIAMNNTISGGRVVRFYLNPEKDAIVRSEVLDCNNPLFQFPTTGTTGDGNFYFIANSQFGSFNQDGSIFPMDQLRDVVILKAKL